MPSLSPNIDEEEPYWFCLKCKSFLPRDQFMKGSKRYLCKKHFYEKNRKEREETKVLNPQKIQAYTTWQVAYHDASKYFKSIMLFPVSKIFKMLETLKLPLGTAARLVPLDPLKPLSVDNFFLTSASARMDMCKIWRKFKCGDLYFSALDSKLGRPIFASSINKNTLFQSIAQENKSLVA
jgi:hypothetical protein